MKPTPPSAEARSASSRPMISIAGIRAIVGDSLHLDEFVNYAQAFMAGLEPKRLVVGGDTRRSGEMMRHLIFAAAIASGVEVHDLGIVPTPTVGFMVRRLKAGGGIVVSASHNPPQWNAFKFFSSSGTFLTPDDFENLITTFHDRRMFRRAPVDRIGRIIPVPNPFAPHLAALLKTLPVKDIRARRFRVVLDACNGAGLDLAVALFKALAITHRVIFSRQDGRFERNPEPLPENLTRLKREVVKFKADIGFALDPDADRLAIVDETGRAIGEERTIVLAIESVLRPGSKIKVTNRKPPVVVNLSTTRAVEDAASRHGVPVLRTAIGEAHVVDRMKASGSQIGGEGNGGVIFPKVHFGRDSATGMGLVLALMSMKAGKEAPALSEINRSIPDYAMVKDKVALADRSLMPTALARLRSRLPELETAESGAPTVDETDGIKIILSDRWLHIRASGTEPIMRLFAEAPSRKEAERLIEWARQTLDGRD